MRHILAILKKELRDTLRDRRTLVSMTVMPLVLMPLIILGMGWLSESQVRRSQEREIKLGVVNATAAPDLVSFLQAQNKLRMIALEGRAEEAVRQEQVDAAIAVPPRWQEDLAAGTAPTFPLFYNSTKTDSAATVSRVTDAVAGYNQVLIQRRLTERGLDPSVLAAPTIMTQDVATAQERGGFFLGLLLPLFLVLWAVAGGMYTAIDVSAGEKERKTLEALLITPVRRVEIVTGKLLAVATVSIVAITLALLSLYVAVLRLGTMGIFAPASPAATMSLRLEPLGMLVMFLVGALLAIMFAALLLAVSIFAKSYREAQSYITPLYLLAILPVTIVSMIPNVGPSAAIFLAPAVNAVFLFKEVLVGTLSPSHILLTVFSLAVYALVATIIATRIFEREGVLFRS